jgi:putative iron-only hydrogenase system regulator
MLKEQQDQNTAGRNQVMTETRVAVISIIVENEDAVQKVNEILHDYRAYIIGRMGIPYRIKGISIISVAIDAPQDRISALSGKIGKLPGISAKTAYSNVITGAQRT